MPPSSNSQTAPANSPKSSFKPVIRRFQEFLFPACLLLPPAVSAQEKVAQARFLGDQVHATIVQAAAKDLGAQMRIHYPPGGSANDSGTAVIVVGHVTKGGGIAGPKTLEHIVDTVLYFEGEASLDYRLLRATKNRYGSVDELGVFSMTGRGLVAVPNPSAVFLAARATGNAGSAVTALMEGTRPVLVEVQALAAPSGYGTPQRVATGVDPKRLAVLLAVLERRGGSSFSQLDVFVQVSAGVRLTEPGADLAVAAALLSSLHNRATPADAIYLGEIGLGGEIRPIAGLDRRLGEASRLGFHRGYGSSRGAGAGVEGIRHIGLDHVGQLVKDLAA